jgi:streptogramin lyase
MRISRCFPFVAAVLLAGCAGTTLLPSAETRVWGSAEAGLVNGPAADARFSNPANVAAAPDGMVFVADYDNDAVRQIAPNGQVTTLVLQSGFSRPFGLAVTADGTLYVQTDGNDLGQRDSTTGTVWRVDRAARTATVVVRNVGRPRGLVALPDGTLAMSDLAHHVIRHLNPATGEVHHIAGEESDSGFVDGTGMDARFHRPYGITRLPNGDLLVADQNNHRIRRVTMAGVVTTFAGTGATGAANGPLASATFNRPQAVAFRDGVVYVSDHGNHLIRSIAAGAVGTFAGSGVAGFADGTGAGASFFGQEGIAAAPGFLWIADGNNGDGDPYNRVRRLPLP